MNCIIMLMANVTVSMENVAKTNLWQSNESSYLKHKVTFLWKFLELLRPSGRSILLKMLSQHNISNFLNELMIQILEL